MSRGEQGPAGHGHELTLSAMTLQRAALEDRLTAAAAAGFDAIGLSLRRYRLAQSTGWTDAVIRDALETHGLRLTEVEGPSDWSGGDPRFPKDTEELVGMAERLGCPQVTVVQFFPADPADRLIAFRHLCQRAADFGAVIAAEFLPFSQMATLADAWRLVAQADEPNGGLALDAWHFFRAEGSLATLDQIPPERIFSIQLNDPSPGPPAPDLRHEARPERLLPAGKALQLTRLLMERYVTARMAVEVWSDGLEALAPKVAAVKAYEAARRVLDDARWP